MNDLYKNLKNLIENKIDIDENFIIFKKEILNVYKSIAVCRLILTSYLLKDIYKEDSHIYNDKTCNYFNKIIGFINIISQTKTKEDSDKLILEINDMRKELIIDLESLIKYTDVFDTYRLLIDKNMYRFKETQENLNFDPKEIAKTHLRKIFSTNDNVIINNNIKMLISNIPVRVTKDKYFDIVKEALLEYKGVNKSSFERVIYLLSSLSMIIDGFNIDDDYKNIIDFKNRLEEIDYDNTSYNEYLLIKSDLKKYINYIEKHIDIYNVFVETINPIYAILLIDNENTHINNDLESAYININNLYINYIEQFKEDKINENILNELEGVQEDLYDKKNYLEGILESLYHLQESSMQDAAFNYKNIKNIESLLSNNLFISLEENNKDYIISQNEMLEIINKFIKDSSNVFNEVNREVVRIIMGKVLGEIPVFFKTHKELMDYVLNSLNKVTKRYEMTAVLDALKNLEY